MENHTIYAVIIDIDTTEIAKIDITVGIPELLSDDDMLKELLEMLAEKNKIWNDVLAGSRAAVLFDGNTPEHIRINRGSKKFIMMP